MQHGVAGCNTRAQNEGPTRIKGCAKRRNSIERDEYIKPLNVRLWTDINISKNHIFLTQSQRISQQLS